MKIYSEWSTLGFCLFSIWRTEHFWGICLFNVLLEWPISKLGRQIHGESV